MESKPPDQPGPDRIFITVKPSGTITVHGIIPVQDLDGNQLTIPTFKQPGVIKFCGCGRSANKPFCDGSHKRESGEEGK